MPQLIKKSEIEKYMSPIGDTLVLLGLSGTFFRNCDTEIPQCTYHLLVLIEEGTNREIPPEEAFS